MQHDEDPARRLAWDISCEAHDACRPQDAWTLGEPIDAVYTWVNGSDPAFIASKIFHKHNELRETDTHEV